MEEKLEKEKKLLRIANRTENVKDHKVRFLVMLDGKPQGDPLVLGSGDAADFELGDTLVILSDSRINYTISTKKGLVLTPLQVNNSHDKFPDTTVALFAMHVTDETKDEGGQDDASRDTETRSGPDDDIIITEPDKPDP